MKSKTAGKVEARVGLVGIGHWGRNLARVLGDLGALTTIFDRDRLVAEEIAKGHPGIKVAESLEEILARKDVTGVVVATPAADHFSTAHAALSAGKSVFVEKPLALRSSEGDRLVALAGQKGLTIFVGHLLHYHPAIRRIKALISQGTIGRLRYIYANRLSLGKFRREENSLWSFAPHDISLILSLAGEDPNLVTATGNAFLHPEIADVTVTNLRFPSGLGAHIFVSWLHPFKEQRLVLVGEKGMLVFEDTKPIEGKLLRYPHTVEWQGQVPSPGKAEPISIDLTSEWEEPLVVECRAFLDCLVTGEQPLTDGREGLRVLRVLEQAQASIGSDKSSNRGAHKSESDYYVHPTAVVDDGARLGSGTKVWHFSHVYKGGDIGRGCVLGQNVMVAEGVCIGNNVKIQNNVSIYSGATLEDDVFVGPSCVFTNISNPRSQVNRQALYEKTLVRRGATLGANSTVVCGADIGRYAFVGAGAVVTGRVPDYALVLGVPARKVGWASRHGHRLTRRDQEGLLVCPESGYRYQEVSPNVLKCLDLDEESPLPAEQAKGKLGYREVKDRA